MLIEPILSILNDYPDIKAHLMYGMNESTVKVALDEYLELLAEYNVLMLSTDEATKTETNAHFRHFFDLLRDRSGDKLAPTTTYEHLLNTFHTIFEYLDEAPNAFNFFNSREPIYPMNPLLLLAIVTSYTNAYIEDVPFDSATFNRAYNLASNSLSTTSISLKDWGRWQRKVLHALDMLSHPTAQKDNYAVEFREAIEFGDTKDLEYLIQNGLRLTANEARKLDAGGWTLIHFAAKHNLPLIPLLIRLGVDPNAKTHNSQATALQIAVEGNCEVVSLSLLNYRNIVVSPANSQGYTPLYYAAKNGNAYILNLLLAKGAYLTNNDIHRPDEQGKTLLHYASRHGAETLVSLLIAQQADPNIQSNSIQETPLHLAVKNGHSKVAKLLLRTAVGIKVDLKDSFGKTAYDYVQEQSTEFRDYEVLQEIVNWRAWQHQPIAPKRAFNTFS